MYKSKWKDWLKREKKRTELRCLLSGDLLILSKKINRNLQERLIRKVLALNYQINYQSYHQQKTVIYLFKHIVTPEQPVSPDEKTPLLFVDVNLGSEQSERIVVFEGDTAQGLAQAFCEDHCLDNETQGKLEQLLDSQIATLLSKIDEENQ